MIKVSSIKVMGSESWNIGIEEYESVAYPYARALIFKIIEDRYEIEEEFGLDGDKVFNEIVAQNSKIQVDIEHEDYKETATLKVTGEGTELVLEVVETMPIEDIEGIIGSVEDIYDEGTGADVTWDLNVAGLIDNVLTEEEKEARDVEKLVVDLTAYLAGEYY